MSPGLRDAVGFTRKQRIADLMTPELTSFVESSLAAERAGDAGAALEFHCGVPMFARGAHKVQLTQLAGLSEEMTPWLWARWALYQCTRAEGEGRAGEAHRQALRYAVEMFYPDRLEEAFDAGDDHVRVLAHLCGESWIFHELCAFEFGGLQAFLDELATGRLAEEGRHAHSWVGSLLGGYRLLEGRAGGALVVQELASGQPFELLDLGAAVHADEEGWLVGRVVPSGTAPALMFHTRPVAVDEQTARAVAADPTSGGWITALKAAFDEGRVDRALFESEDRELATDVPSLSLLEVGTPPQALEQTLDQLARGRDEIGRAAYRILRGVAEDTFGPDARAPYVAAAVLNPHGHAEAWRLLSRNTPRERWARWARLVPEPSRARLLRLASLARAA